MTNESNTLREFRKFFDLREVVSKQVYERYGQAAWTFFDLRLLAVVVWLRQNLNIPLVCNNWAKGGQLDERGFRANLDPTVASKTKAGKLYCTAHSRGQALDLSSGKMTAEEMRRWIRQHREDLPFPIRMEKDVNWLHIDVANVTNEILVEFKV